MPPRYSGEEILNDRSYSSCTRSAAWFSRMPYDAHGKHKIMRPIYEQYMRPLLQLSSWARRIEVVPTRHGEQLRAM